MMCESVTDMVTSFPDDEKAMLSMLPDNSILPAPANPEELIEPLMLYILTP